MQTHTINGLFLRLSSWPLATDKPTLVMIHGSGGTGVLWEGQVTGLADIANVVAVDLPGHGDSEGQLRASIPEYAEIVSGLIPELGVSRAIVCGLSLGSAIALQLMLDHKEVVAGGVLLGTGARLRVMPLIFAAIEQDFGAFVRDMPRGAASPRTDPAVLAPLMAAVANNGPKASASGFRACDAFDVMSRLGEIDVPVLVVSGEDDLLTPPKYAGYLAAHIAGARLSSVPDAGHLSAIERPEAVNAAIRDWLHCLK